MVIDGKPALLVGTSASLSPDFDSALESFRLAAWYALVTRYETPNECIRLCVTGTSLLRRMGFEAEAVFCELFGYRSDGQTFFCGISPENLILDAAKYGREVQPDQCMVLNPQKGASVHMVIRVRRRKEWAIIDPTVCQLWPIIGEELPTSWVVPGRDWTTVRGESFSVCYKEGRIGKSEGKSATKFGFSDGLYADMKTLMEAAQHFQNDSFQILTALHQESPHLTVSAAVRKARWMVRL